MAGNKWFKNFVRRHRELAFRTPQLISLAGVRSFTKEELDAFFDRFKSELQKVKFYPAKVFNVCETGVSIFQRPRTNVFSVKGKKHVTRLSSAARSSMMTFVACMDASGIFVPPLFVSPRARLKPELLYGTPAGTVTACHPLGLLQTPVFTHWFEQFVKVLKTKPDVPIVLTLGDHFSHTANLEVIGWERELGMHIMCLPPTFYP
jgi:hypothetical protein